MSVRIPNVRWFIISLLTIGLSRSSLNAIFIGSSNEIGAFESGVAANLLGTVPSVVAGGLATLLVVTITGLRVPERHRLREIR